MKKIISQKGFSLLEMLIYISILSMLLVVVVTVLVTVARSYTTLKISKNINHAAVVSMERMTREIKGAQTVMLSQSVLDASVGRLALQTSVGNTVEFYIMDGTIRMNINGAYYGPLTSNDVTVTNLLFAHSTTTESEAVKINMTLKSGVGTKERTENFYGTAVLRKSY